MFRVLADQLEGNESLHAGYRAEVLRFMCGHREDFEPFVEDDEAWDHYVGRMARDSTWGGNLELQAASRRYEVNIVIHIVRASPDHRRRGAVSVECADTRSRRQLEAPPYEILNPAAARAIHMSYHGGEHYNSVRHKVRRAAACAAAAAPRVTGRPPGRPWAHAGGAPGRRRARPQHGRRRQAQQRYSGRRVGPGASAGRGDTRPTSTSPVAPPPPSPTGPNPGVPQGAHRDAEH